MTAGDTKSRRLIWLLSAIAIGVLAVLAYTARSGIALFVRFHVAARLVNSDQLIRSNVRIDKEDLDALADFAPQQVASYLQSSRADLRVIACQVLRRQSEDNVGRDWTGIAPILAHMALNDPEQPLRQRALDTIDRLRSIAIDDGREILADIRKQPDNPIAPRLAELTLSRCPDILNELQATLLPTGAGAAGEDTAFLSFVELLPNDEGLQSLLKNAIRDASPLVVDIVRKLAEHRPEIVATLLQGADQDKRIVILALSRPFKWPPTARVPAEPEEANTQPALLADRAANVALEYLQSDDASSRSMAINFLQNHPSGGRFLVQNIDRADPATCVEILKSLREIAWARYHANDEAFQFTKQESDHLVALLENSDNQIRAEIVQVLNPGIPPAPQPGGVFVPGSGPSDPANADVFRRLLDASTGEHDWLALNYFSRITPFEECDVERIVRAVLREGSSAQTWQTHQAFKVLCERYPNHPQVVACALELIARPRWSSIKSNAAIHLLNFPEHYPVALQQIRDYVQSATQERSTVLERAILTKAIQDRSVVDGELLGQIASRELRASWFSDSWPSDLPAREEIASLIEPEAVRALERTVLQQCLESIVRNRRPGYASAGIAQLTDRMRAAPDFVEQAVAITEHAIASDDVELRVAGLKFLVEAKLDAANLTRAAIECLNDQQPKVVVAAADTLGSMGIQEPSVIVKLRELVDRKQTEAVRAAAVRNLAVLKPNDPETRRMLKSLVDDANFAVRSEARRALKAIAADE